MTRIGFYLFIKPLSLLPLPVLYAITWPLYFLMTRFFPYRHKTVRENLRKSFPDKDARTLKRIERGFYRHFTDQILETLRQVSMSDEEGQRRMKIVNSEILAPYYQQKRNIALVMGHYNNWEYTPFMNTQMQHQFIAIYAKLTNKFMNGIVKQLRSRVGSLLVERKEVGSFLRQPFEKPYMLIFLSDQSPNMRSKVHWTNFLNQPTPVATGTERYAQMLNMVVVFGHFDKVKRGHYEMTFEILTDQPKEEPEGRITEMHVRALERQILQSPEYWLWSHKRWKRSNQAPEGLQ